MTIYLSCSPMVVKSKTQVVPPKPTIHTDLLAKKYGPITADVLRHDLENNKHLSFRLREVRLIDAENISRTHAVTFLNDPESYLEIDKEIEAGGSMGITFRKYGYDIRRNVVDVFIMEIPDWLCNDFKVLQNTARVKVTEFHAKQTNKKPVVYGTLVEILSPDFADPKLPKEIIYPKQTNPFTAALLVCGSCIENIRECLNQDPTVNDFTRKDMKDVYDRALVANSIALQPLRAEIHKHINSR